MLKWKKGICVTRNYAASNLGSLSPETCFCPDTAYGLSWAGFPGKTRRTAQESSYGNLSDHFYVLCFEHFSCGVQIRGLLSLFHNCYFSPSPSKLISFLFCPSQSLAYFPPSLKSVASHRHSLAARLKPMVMDLWRLVAGLLAIFHFSSIFVCIWDFGWLVQPQRLSLSSQSMPCSRDSLVGKLRGENVLKLIMASCDENIWSVVGTCCLPRQDRCCTQNEQNNFLQEFNCQIVEKSSSILRSTIPLRNKGPKVTVVT